MNARDRYDIIVLDKESMVGGTPGIAIGSLMAHRTPHQRKSNIRNSWEEHAEDAAHFAPEAIEKRNNAGLREFSFEGNLHDPFMAQQS
ncbi:MAG: hypothetical protein M2R45_00015 [Verrucomicrobia subdivision 3 bacterium]|nr:hypothetical protein [Limisphaerales bacterium]MCS1412526.1 hypothetical protein [Limisphaerales bacterium]